MKNKLLILLLAAGIANTNCVTRIIVKQPNPKLVIHLIHQTKIQVLHKKDSLVVSIPSRIISQFFAPTIKLKKIVKSKNKIDVIAEYINGRIMASISGNTIKIDYTNSNFKREIKTIYLSKPVYNIDKAIINWSTYIAGNEFLQIIVPK